MRIARLLPLAALLVGASVPTLAAPPDMQLGYNGGSNSHPHNLSSLSGSGVRAAPGGETQICIFCHTPHGASPTATPLWNRMDPGGSFPLYGNGSGILEIESIPAAKYTDSDFFVQYPNGSTRMCMSCHDGSTAVGTVLNGGELDSGLMMTAAGIIDLSTSHPVSFVYDDAVRAELHSRGKGNFLPPPAKWLDSEKRMQCTTCHDPHVDTKGGGYGLPMWANFTGIDKTDVDYSATCNSCHGGTIPGTFPGGAGDGHQGF